MPSKQQQSEKSSTVSRTSSSSSPLSKARPKSLIVSQVALTQTVKWLFDDLNHNYPDVKKVSRNHDQDGNELGSIRVDFHSEETVAEILDEDAIYIEDRPYYIRPYWPLICYRCHKEGHIGAQCPQQPVPEWRLDELLDQQKNNFETLINEFENRWNKRISTLQTSVDTTKTNQLLPVVNDLAGVCQQLNMYNIQMQKQLSTIANHVQQMQTKIST